MVLTFGLGCSWPIYILSLDHCHSRIVNSSHLSIKSDSPHGSITLIVLGHVHGITPLDGPARGRRTLDDIHPKTFNQLLSIWCRLKQAPGHRLAKPLENLTMDQQRRPMTFQSLLIIQPILHLVEKIVSTINSFTMPMQLFKTLAK